LRLRRKLLFESFAVQLSALGGTRTSPRSYLMNFSLNGASGIMLLIPVVVWLIWLYIVIRFLRAFERGVQAHERIAAALLSSPEAGRGSSPFDDRAT